MQFATNHLGHFQLTSLLWEALKNAKSSRVINLSSRGHRFSEMYFEDLHFTERPYDKWKAYGQSKTADVLFSVELDRRGTPLGIRSFAVHPGRIPATALLRDLDREEMKAAGVTIENNVIQLTSGMKDIEQGAATTPWCATSPALSDKGGVYCADCNISNLMSSSSDDRAGVRDYAIDPEAAKKLWTMSEQMLSQSQPNQKPK